MKRPVLLSILLIVTGIATCQTIKKGSLIAFTEITVKLNPGATIDQYLNLLVNEYVPATEKALPGARVFFMKGDRGNAESKLGGIWLFESVQARDTYFDAEGNFKPPGAKAAEKMAPVMAKLEKLGTSDRTFTRWIVLNNPRSEVELMYYKYLKEYCAKDDCREVPLAPSAMGISEPMLERLIGDLAGYVGELKVSGAGPQDSRYSELTSNIQNAKKSVNEVVTALMGSGRQAYQKGGSFGLHVLTVTLAPDVTMDQFLDYLITRYVPEVVKQFKGVEILIMKQEGDGREDQIAWVNYFESETSRNTYWPEEDTRSEKANLAYERVQSILFELLKLGTWTDDNGVWVFL
jgi:hypothetical protein